MKKLMILLAVACLICVSCGTKTQPAQEPAEETCGGLTPEQQEMFDNWEVWADLSEEQQVALVDDMKTFMDDECKAKCAEKCAAKEDAEEAEQMCPKKAAHMEELKIKWEDFDNLTLDDKKALIDEIQAMHKCCKDKEEGEKTECEKKCDHK
jgi:hypothetical protein